MSPAMPLIGWTLIAIGAGVGVLLLAYRDRPKVRHLITGKDLAPAPVDDFDAHVDQALAIANDSDTPELLIFCQECRGPFAATTLRDLLTHLRTPHAPGSDWSLWESELRSDR